MTPEERLLCSLGQCPAPALSDLDWAMIDWGQVLVLAIPHGILPLLYARVGQMPAGRCPQSLLDQLARVNQCHRLRSEAQLLETARVQDLLLSQGVRNLTFKGAALSQLAFGDPHLRESYDLDLIVAPSDWDSAKALLLSNGFVGVSTNETRDPADRWDATFRRGTIAVELHWRLFSPRWSFDIPFDGLWDRRLHLNVSGAHLDTFGREDYLTYLSAHGDKHMWRRIQWLYDLDALIGSVSESALRGGNKYRFALALMQGIGIRARSPHAKLSRAHRMVAAALARRILTKAVSQKTVSSICFEIIVRLTASEGPRARLTHLREIASDILALTGSDSPSKKAGRYLFWPSRLGRLLWRYRPKSPRT